MAVLFVDVKDTTLKSHVHPILNRLATMRRAILRTALLCAVAVAAVSATSLTKDNYEELSAGKVVFVKFQAPWSRPGSAAADRASFYTGVRTPGAWRSGGAVHPN